MQWTVFCILATHGICLQAGNKFETIGGGVSGSTPLKLESLSLMATGFGVLFLVCGLLSLLPLGHENALTLNHANWKLSAGVFFVFSFLCFLVTILV